VDEALAVAHSEALKGLVTTATGPRKVELQRTLDSLTIKKG
jgi:hypothetical protein